MKDDYISLQKATEICNYSQEYLSLRARQGKFKAIKFGRNWVTKKEWLEEYLYEIKDHKKNHKKYSLAGRKKQKELRISAPPKNLPIEKIPLFQLPQPRFGFIVALTFVLLASGITFGKSSFQNVYYNIEPSVYSVKDTTKEIFTDMSDGTEFALQNIDNEIQKIGHEMSGGIKIVIQETEKEVIFLRNVKKGSSNRSYGIEVAKLAGLPENVISRAKDLLADLRDDDRVIRKHPPKTRQNSLFQIENILLERVRSLDPDNMSPKEAPNALYELKKEIKE